MSKTEHSKFSPRLASEQELMNQIIGMLAHFEPDRITRIMAAATIMLDIVPIETAQSVIDVSRRMNR